MAINFQNTQSFPQISAPFVDEKSLITPPWRQFLQALWTRTGAGQGSTIFTSGMVITFAGMTLPAGWVLCDGSAISRNVYANLFSAIGTTWGGGDGTNTFNVPNLVDKFILGAGISPALGTNGGTAEVTLGISNLASHSHGVTDPGHVHGITDPGHHHTSETAASNVTAGASAGGVTAGNTGNATTGITINSATTGITTQDTGSAAPFSILPPYAAIYYIIKQ